jgi:RNA polymerase sigma-70 factor (ECF subfamily)
MSKTIQITETQLKCVVNSLLIESNQNSDDSYFISGIKAGDQKVITQFYEHYYKFLLPRLKTITHKLSEQELNQIVSDSLMRGIKKIDLYNGKGPLDGWLYIIMRRLYSSYVKENKKELENKLIPIDYIESTPIDSTKQDFMKDLMAKFKMFLETQSKHVKKTAELYLAGYSHEEMAKILGNSRGTTKWQVNSIMTKFKRWLVDNKHI